MIGLWIWLTAAMAAPLSADEAVTRALERSVEVARAEAALRVQGGEVRAASGLRADPQVEGRWSLLGDAHGLALTQPISLSGEGRALHQQALAAEEAAGATRSRTTLQVAATTRVVWMRAVEARQAVALAQAGLSQATRLRVGAEARHEAGDGSLLEARLARLQETEARTGWMTAVVAEGERLAELAAWTGVGLEELELPEDPLAGMPEVALEAGSRGDLEAARLGVEAARAGASAQRAGTLPPVRLGGFYEVEDGAPRAGLSLGLTLPLWNANAAGRARAGAELAVAQAGLADRERTTAAEHAATARVLHQLQTGAPEVDPREEARLALEGVALGYETGELDLLTAGLLRQQIIEGQRAWLLGRRVLGEARVAGALAHEAAELLP